MTKLKGLLLTEGMHGMISQVEGLANALDIDFTHHKVELNSFWKLIPPKFTPVSNFTFNPINPKDFDIIISCGRKSVIPSIYLKKNSEKKIYNIHIQDPKVDLKNFDFVVAPDHDGLTGENVILSKGSIHYLTKEEMIHNHEYLSGRLNKEKEYLTLIVGGPNKYYHYNDKNISNIFDKIKNILEKNNLQAIIIPSMRTPKKIIELSNNYFVKEHLVINDIYKKAKYPKRIFIGVFEQNDEKNENEVCARKTKNYVIKDNVRTINLSYKDAKGPFYARSLINHNLFKHSLISSLKFMKEALIKGFFATRT